MSPGEAGETEGQKPGPGRKATPEIKGNTLRVYLFLLRRDPSELREVQRGLGLSTPSLASYHLEKLIAAGYASQNERGQYSAVREASGEILEGFSRIGVLLVPQLLFFAVLFTPVVGYFAMMSLYSSAYVPFLAVSSLCLVAVIWYQTVRVWRRLSSAR
ncbi:MAG: helix-turn-helix domain-containing protein [Thaumarchaeota archaeon]|nr:helix-turn-helix domain-containing protein [Nitrososphaerota archaeon]